MLGGRPGGRLGRSGQRPGGLAGGTEGDVLIRRRQVDRAAPGSPERALVRRGSWLRRRPAGCERAGDSSWLDEARRPRRRASRRAPRTPRERGRRGWSWSEQAGPGADARRAGWGCARRRSTATGSRPSAPLGAAERELGELVVVDAEQRGLEVEDPGGVHRDRHRQEAAGGVGEAGHHAGADRRPVGRLIAEATPRRADRDDDVAGLRDRARARRAMLSPVPPAIGWPTAVCPATAPGSTMRGSSTSWPRARSSEVGPPRVVRRWRSSRCRTRRRGR